MGEADEKRNYYAVLGAESDASREEIERRYKRLAVEHHPDRGGDEERMKSINEAWRVLRDDASRSAYDASRRISYAPVFAPSVSGAAQADAIGGRVAGSLLCLFAGLVLVFLVRFHYVVFLWPLALLGALLILFGVWMAHAALDYAREGYAPNQRARRLIWAQEAAFWFAVTGGVYVLYSLLTVI